MSEESGEQPAQRRAKLAELRARGQAYPNDFRRDAEAGALHERFAETDAEALERAPVAVAVAGRMMTRRIMGKASFAHLRDGTGSIQVYLRRDDLPEGQYAGFRKFDLGDVVGVEGTVFRTKTGRAVGEGPIGPAAREVAAAAAGEVPRGSRTSRPATGGATSTSS